MRQREVDDAMMPDEHEQHEQQQHEHKLEIMDDLRQDGDDDDDDGIGGKRRLFRFKPAFDVVLVREVIRCFPWSAGYGRTRSAWMSVATRVQTTLETLKGVVFTRGSALDHAIVKRRVDMLLEAYRKNEMSGLRGSGSPEEFDMRNKLLAILARVVDEQTLNKGAMREKRVQSALQVAQRNLAELEGTVGMVMPASADLSPPPAVATQPLMPIAPVPATSLAVVSHGNSSPVLPSLSAQQNVQQNGSNKRALRTGAVSVASPMQEVKRPRVENTAVSMETTLDMEERKLRLEERRVELEEERLAFEKQKSEQDEKERQALLDVLRAQGSLVTELLTHLRSSKISSNTQGL
ncbi:hypothetical protein KXD40_005346 [Peronospora effusa]|uniref:Uncharacterized protein n=1 Tax=Peronospora effusa TaxID=542832 RepID=A0A3M6VS68_9STRA|nr:hypothetical protein DD238_001704 [Peronospora effusa]RQM16732.1 hypothetical protein DD237_000565 [Peronospora effusa]UIZ22632.1 hypothetical protein KXD40_005346 [Peronospora effusa]CAI5703550.1 unnamed protein product [Peronospora effusa]